MSWKLMENNIPQDDLQYLSDFIIKNPVLTNSQKVKEFEAVWSDWAEVKYSVYVNSGGNANLMTMLVLKQKLIDEGVDENDLGEVIVSSVNWITDISSVMLCGFKPVFVDVNLDNLSMDLEQVYSKINEKTRAVVLTHLMGFNAISDELIARCKRGGVMLIEDCCESHGATYKNRKIGSFGDMSCYSFYYGHHITTVEGGMICTNDEKTYQMLRMFRSHGLVRECTNEDMKREYYDYNPEPAPEFVFAYPGFNFRGTEIGAVLGIRQIEHLGKNIEIRRRNFDLFLSLIDPTKYKTDFNSEGNSNFGLVIVLREKDEMLMGRLIDILKKEKIDFRRGIAGGGNQLRQPYLRKKNFGAPTEYGNAEHIHFFSVYIGNHQNITEDDIRYISELLNNA